MFRFHHDKDRIDNDAYAAETSGAKPENTCPDFAFVKTVYAKIA
jgi:hypothetical protein